ncbi:hypothetical protein SUGI_0134510 [Cryptomeria japonica]|nr:hypothetical protein SUGI_0134510 [Cryptomeria japonica]
MRGNYRRAIGNRTLNMRFGKFWSETEKNVDTVSPVLSLFSTTSVNRDDLDGLRPATCTMCHLRRSKVSTFAHFIDIKKCMIVIREAD